MGWRYFFMVININNKIIINDIMYSLSIATTSFRGDDDITALLFTLFFSLTFNNGFLYRFLLYIKNPYKSTKVQ